MTATMYDPIGDAVIPLATCDWGSCTEPTAVVVTITINESTEERRPLCEKHGPRVARDALKAEWADDQHVQVQLFEMPINSTSEVADLFEA